MSRFGGKVALITGGSSGIGKATAILFASEGAKVVVADCIAQGAEETVRIIRETGGEATFVSADVSKPVDVQSMVETTIRTYGQLNILFNNAGIGQPITATADIPEEVWDEIMNVNLKGVFLGMKYGIPHMLDKGGVIINTASTAGILGFTYGAAYAASKAGIIGLTKTAALEYANRNIRINCICPGTIQTPQVERARSSPEWQRHTPLRSPCVMGRRGTPEEVAQSALFLASDESSSFITGTALVIDGGYSAL